jgi:photosystem II stability/assembly factor-like uncharacterized protein
MVILMVGTRKGAFLFRSRPERRTFSISGPSFEGIPVYHMMEDPRDGPRFYAAVNHEMWGPRIYRSTDLGESWNELPAQPRLKGRGRGRKARSVKRIWHVAPGLPGQAGRLYAGVDPGALFRSDSDGESWEEVQGINDHPTRPRWFPGAGGLCLHSIALDGTAPERLYVGISAAGVFRSDDGGRTFVPANRGVRADFLPDKYPEVGQCVHKLLLHPARPGRLFQQNHCGFYRSDRRGERWKDLSKRLPSRFGFGLALHPHDPDTLYTVPMKADMNRITVDDSFAVYGSRDAGESWRRLDKGLPRPAYLNVLREALATDQCDPAGIYAGTTTGQLFGSRDEGKSWRLLAGYLPPINSVRAVTLGV